MSNVYDTFLYNGVNMLETFGIKVITAKLLAPNLRPRKVVIPTRSGAVDYGANFHDEQTLRFECHVTRRLSQEPGNNEFDALKHLLCCGKDKGRIVRWDQPDRYYYGRVYEQDIVQEYFMHAYTTFLLNFTVDPYAYDYDPETASAKPTIIKTDTNEIKMEDYPYLGTRETPTRITIKNTGNTPIQGVRIKAYVRR